MPAPYTKSVHLTLVAETLPKEPVPVTFRLAIEEGNAPVGPVNDGPVGPVCDAPLDPVGPVKLLPVGPVQPVDPLSLLLHF